MKTLIQVAEVWVLDADGYLLELADGIYNGAVEFGAVSRAMCFGRGEGLPGRVWDEGRPIILKDLQVGYFRRAKAAKAAGLTCAIGCPIFYGSQLKAVLIFFCGSENWGAGAIELWKNDPAAGSALTLVDGYYGSTAQSFEADSRNMAMSRGSGLAGLAWNNGSAVFIEDLSSDPKFLRAEAAAAAGLHHGLAIPCALPSHETYVMTFLSSAATPIAMRVESWAPDESGGALQRNFGFCEIAGSLPTGELVTTPGYGEDAIAVAFASATPRVLKRSAEDPHAMGDAETLVGASGLIALPILRAGKVAEAVVLYL